MIKEKNESEARRRILNTARDLFYRQGYRATGINEIIEKSGVAKATFYAHFPSKESLAHTYVQTMNREEAKELGEFLTRYRSPGEKLMGLFDFLLGWSKERRYRGCGYLNISSEIPDPAHPVRRESQAHYRAVRGLIGDLMAALKREKGPAWAKRNAETLADDFMLTFAGAITMSQIDHDAEPIRRAREAAARLLG